MNEEIMAKKILICRVEYETTDAFTWKANILAYSMKDALDYIQKNVKTLRSITSTGVYGEINAIEPNVYDDYFTKTEVTETVVKNVIQEVKETDIKCYWCDKTFKSSNNLMTHIKKFHI